MIKKNQKGFYTKKQLQKLGKKALRKSKSKKTFWEKFWN
jgi:hypothetical protein